MKRATRTLLVYGAAAALVGLVLWDNRASAGVPSGYAVVTAQAGVTSANIPAPANGHVAVVLPAGAKGWIVAKQASAAAATPITIPLPAGLVSPLVLSGVSAGTVLAVQWTDVNGATQGAFFGFVAPSPVAAIGLLAGLGPGHPLMRPG